MFDRKKHVRILLLSFWLNGKIWMNHIQLGNVIKISTTIQIYFNFFSRIDTLSFSKRFFSKWEGMSQLWLFFIISTMLCTFMLRDTCKGTHLLAWVTSEGTHPNYWWKGMSLVKGHDSILVTPQPLFKRASCNANQPFSLISLLSSAVSTFKFSWNHVTHS